MRIAEAGVPMAFHAGLSGVNHYGKLWGTGGGGGGGFTAFSHQVFPMVAFADRGISDTFAALICHGVLERFPTLNGLAPGQGLSPGDKVKLVVAGR